MECACDNPTGVDNDRASGRASIDGDCENPCEFSETDDLIINCVKTNNLRFLDLMLYEPDSNLNCVYYGENMLMLAIRMGFEEMAKFLIENGVDYNFKKILFNKTVSEDDGEVIEYHWIDCRQMAYRHEMFEVVEMIDFLNNKHFRFYPAPKFKLRDRSDKPGMFSDVISLNEEFFSENFVNSNETSCTNSNKVISGNNLTVQSLSNTNSVPRSRSANISSSRNDNKSKDNKSSFLRKRTSSAKSQTFKSGRVKFSFTQTIH